MKTCYGDIWAFYDAGYYVCIPTNLGWTRDGRNVMGAGLAKQAKERFPALPLEVGREYRRLAASLDVNSEPPVFCSKTAERIILVPSKPLNVEQPEFSWRSKSTIDFVRRSLLSLKKWLEEHPACKVAIPLIGAGCGELPEEVSASIIQDVLGKSSVCLVNYQRGQKSTTPQRRH